jgi:hypothetical protein
MARRLRKKFPNRSIPKKRKRRWRDEDYALHRADLNFED